MAHRIVREHDAIGVPPVAENLHGIDSIVNGNGADAKVVEAQAGAVGQQCLVVVGVEIPPL